MNKFSNNSTPTKRFQSLHKNHSLNNRRHRILKKKERECKDGSYLIFSKAYLHSFESLQRLEIFFVFRVFLYIVKSVLRERERESRKKCNKKHGRQDRKL
jgi:hypothetical protein